MGEIFKRIHANYMALKYSYRICRSLLSDQRYFASVRDEEYLDAEGNYLPWYTYPAIEAIKNWDLSGKRVFEYSSGYSTLFWASRAREIISVEHDPVWHEKMSKLAPVNAKVILAPISQGGTNLHPTPKTADEIRGYAEAIKNFGIFDVIIVDGAIRQQCARAARPQLSEEGLMILDNSDWLPETARFLRGSGLIEVDLSGLKPARDYSQTTSFFFARGFNFQPRGRQPLAPVGGRIVDWETVADESWRP
jgi:hypothetical protein